MDKRMTEEEIENRSEEIAISEKVNGTKPTQDNEYEESERLTLILEPISKRVSVNKGMRVYDVLIALNYPIGALCGGSGACGKCLIKVDEKDSKDTSEYLGAPTQAEYKLLGKDKIEEGYRLACQTHILKDIRIFLTDTILPKSNRILVDADIKSLGLEKFKEFQEIKPLVLSIDIEVDKPTLENQIDDFSRVIRALRKKIEDKDGTYNLINSNNPNNPNNPNNQNNQNNLNIKNIDDINDTNYRILQKLPHILRETGGKITLFLRNRGAYLEIFDVGATYKIKDYFGLAVDIGTTTIVGYLINLLNGEVSSISAMLNPQVSLGEDLVSRISYIKKNNAIEKGKKLIVDAINKIIDDCISKSKVKRDLIKDVVVVGNTGIHHMFFGVPSQYLAVTPFVPVCKHPINISAASLGINLNPNVNIYTPPVIAGYVGTDTIGCIVSSRIDTYEKFTLLIDIGTNGELVLGNKYQLSTGSCAAGSALEGATISFGMRAAEGAIEAVKIDKKTLDPEFRIIGNKKPIGICGSGLIDVVAEMLRAKIITRAGRFNVKDKDIINNRRVFKKDKEYYYILYHPEWDKDKIPEEFDYDSGDSAKKDENKDEDKIITVSQEDIRQLQLAKGAFLAGALILLHYQNKDYRSLEQIILAGAFGTYISKENAAFIGLFPDINTENIYQIGNAAGMGAQYCLKNTELRNLADEMAHKIKYYEIASSPIFQHEYAYSLYFPYYDLDKFPSLKEEYKDIPVR
ncbi:MAG: ASKHA domain-containing protein [Promethearchaeota archaeon]